VFIDLAKKWYELRGGCFHIDECWRKYREELPELFDDYMRFWGAPPSSDAAIPSRQECMQRVEMVREVYSEVGSGLVRLTEFTGPPPDLVVIVGSAHSNGHAVRIRESHAAWVDVVSLSTASQVRVFTTHELAHAIHYTVNPSLYHSPATFHMVIRKLWTEGVATYLTMRTLDCTPQEALWADYLSPEELRRWMVRITHNEKELWAELNKHTWRTDPEDRLFSVNEHRPLEQWRTGYFCGLRLASRLASEVGTRSLLDLSVREVEPYLL